MTSIGRAWLDLRGRGGTAAAVWAVALVLSGCSVFSGGGSGDAPLTSRFSNPFASSSPPPTPAAASQETPTFNADDCPGVDIRTGAGTLSITGNSKDAATSDGASGEGTSAELRYQLSFGRLARQCTLVGSTLVMKVGVQGRIIVGPAGGPGEVDVPVRYAVVQEGPTPKTIVTKFKRIPQVVPSDESNIVFSDVEDNLSFPLPPQQELESYVVYVGFDEIGDGPEKKPAKKPPPKRK